jgi:hypothetical protein
MTLTPLDLAVAFLAGAGPRAVGRPCVPVAGVEGGRSVRLVIAIIALWIGSTLIWVATHGTDATSPWQLFKQITDKIGGE